MRSRRTPFWSVASTFAIVLAALPASPAATQTRTVDPFVWVQQQEVTPFRLSDKEGSRLGSRMVSLPDRIHECKQVC